MIREIHATRFGLFVRCMIIVATLFGFGAASSDAAEQDLQFWFPVQVIQPIKEKWALSVQAEIRLEDNISEFSEFVVKPGLHYAYH